MLKILTLCIFATVNLSAVSVYFDKTSSGCRIEHHRFDDRQGVAIHHPPQNPDKFPKRGNKKEQRDNKRNGHGD